MKEDDLRKVIPLYIDYYNNHENCCWTEATAFKRIHQAFVMEDAYCIIAEENDVRAKGAKLIQLTSVNDEMHHHFYKKLGFCNTTNLIGKNKFLG